ncbi:hypothetical protein [Saccharothrix variisporea]|uniref:Uncharacterized protein n=1 Tax=Saccharothrix variisporea TaxID=543527 RepID=A0A495X6S5_9PSEU|nr:hypothetical protein [Saccharothrix variisporea]RKT68835.1 hypothetical protein DFJ66_2028 [Saccharothrix variisporea]
MLVPVIEDSRSQSFGLWPVSEPARWLVLGAAMTADQVGTALYWVLSGCADREPPADLPAAVERVITADDVVVAGGLVVRGPGVVVEPGCCCGLEDWRDWTDVARGEIPYLGHDPSPQPEFLDGVVRVWVDEDRRQGYVDVEQVALPGLLESAQRDLMAFLDRTRAWAERYAPGRAAELVAALDRLLHVTGPL